MGTIDCGRASVQVETCGRLGEEGAQPWGAVVSGQCVWHRINKTSVGDRKDLE